MSKVIYSGESGFTFQFFQNLVKNIEHQRRFLGGIKFVRRGIRPFKGDRIKDIYLFQDFGRHYGLGQPDAVLITREGRILIVEVEPDFYPGRWNELTKRLIQEGKSLKDKDAMASLFEQYRSTPLYRLERAHLIGAGTVRYIRGGRDPDKRYCGVLPFSDQFAERPVIKNCTLRRRMVLQSLIKRIRAAKEFYVILFSIRGKPRSSIHYLFEALKKVEAGWPDYRDKMKKGEIQYKIPHCLSRSSLHFIVGWAINHPIDIRRFGYFFFRRNQFALLS